MRFIKMCYSLLLSVCFILLIGSVVVFGDVITEIGYDNGLSLEVGETLIMNNHIRPYPSGSSLEELHFGSMNSSVASVNVDENGIVTLTAHKEGYCMLSVYNDNCAEIIDIFVVYPRSGYELDYEPNLWNRSSLLGTRNCYTYAFNFKEDISAFDNIGYFLSPGEIANALSFNGIWDRQVYDLYSNENASFFIENVRDDTRAMLGYRDFDEVLKCIDHKSFVYTTDVDPFDEPAFGGTYKVVLTVSKSSGKMHWYRQDSNGLWSHKMGDGYVTNLDSNGDYIIDPRTCAKIYQNEEYEYIGCYETEPWQGGVEE